MPRSKNGKKTQGRQTQSQPSDISVQPTENDPMFNSVVHTQSGMPNLIDLMISEYGKYGAKANQDRGANSLPALDIAKTIRVGKPLTDFFKKYLEVNRPVQIFPIDMNYGLVLSNNMRCAISPGVQEIKGTMQNSGAVSVTSGGGNPYQDGIVASNSIPVT